MVLQGGCVRLKGERRSPVIVWPNEAALDLVSEPGKVRVLNRLSGETIELDKGVNLGGNSGDLTDETNIIDANPACPGPYFQMGNFGPLEPIEQSEIEGRATALQQERRLSRVEALRLAREERARDERFHELRARLLKEAPDSYAGLYPYQGRATIKFSHDPEAELRRLVPPDLLPFATAERAPRPLAELKAEKDRFLDQVERIGLSARAYEDIEHGRIVITAEDLRTLSRAAAAEQIEFPPGAVVQSQGAMPEGQFGDEHTQALNRRLESAPDWAKM